MTKTTTEKTVSPAPADDSAIDPRQFAYLMAETRHQGFTMVGTCETKNVLDIGEGWERVPKDGRILEQISDTEWGLYVFSEFVDHAHLREAGHYRFGNSSRSRRRTPTEPKLPGDKAA